MLLLIPSPHNRESILLAVHSARPHKPLFRHRPCLACLHKKVAHALFLDSIGWKGMVYVTYGRFSLDTPVGKLIC